MIKLAKQGGTDETDTALGANEYTKQFIGTYAKNGMILYALTGDFSAQTVALEVSYDGGSNFVAYVAPDATGTPAAVTYTDDCNAGVYGPGQIFRFHCSNGGTPDIDIQISGDVALRDD